MPTEQDYRLQPQLGPLSKVICNYCDREIGEVYTAAQTSTGVRAGQSEEQITLKINDLVRDHFAQAHPEQSNDASSYENDSPRRPPQKEPLRHQGR